MVPQARLNPEAPEFFPNQHHSHNLVHSISWSSHQFYSREFHTLQPQYSVYLPTITVPLTSTSFHDGTTNTSQQLNTPLLASSEAEPTHFFDVTEKKEGVVGAEKEGSSKGVAQKQVFKGIKGCGRMNGRDGLRSSVQGYAWRRKGKAVAEEDQQKYYYNHFRSRQVIRPVDNNFNAFPKKKRGFQVFPVREDGDETTIMIKNIPAKYSRDKLVEFLDNHCIVENSRDEGEDHTVLAFDFVYLPIDFRSGLNKGYAFVNFTNPKAAWRFNLTASNRKWELFQSHKIREVVAARLQGKEKLKRHFETMNFPCESVEVLPVCFSPPRDGVIKGEQQALGKLVKPQQL